jgi:hypothetical protein
MTYVECLEIVAPWYNLVLVGIVIALFIKFFMKPSKKIYLKPWIMLFIAICVYIIEEGMTAFGFSAINDIYRILHPLFEMIMISLFIYMLLLQRDYLRELK